MPDHNYFANLIWQIADLLRGPYRPPQYERVMLPMTVLRRFDCVLASSKPKVLAEHARLKGSKVEGEALDQRLNKAAGQRFHNHSPLDFEKLKGDPDNIEKHLVSYIKGFSKNVRDIFDFFEFENEIERMREANILYLVVSKFCDVDLHPGANRVPNVQMGLIFENLIRRFNVDACPHLLDDVQAIDKELGREPQRDWNAVWSRIIDILHERNAIWRKFEKALFSNVFTEKDPDAEPVVREGGDDTFLPDPDLRDFENVPLKDDIDAYFEREVRPHVPDAWMDRSKDKVGYEINFNRHFYNYTPPRPLSEIDAELKQAEEQIMRLLREVTE